jgi:hypothetical protein
VTASAKRRRESQRAFVAIGKREERQHIRLTSTSDANHFLVDHLLPTELDLRERIPDCRMKPECTLDCFLANHPDPIPPPHM